MLSPKKEMREPGEPAGAYFPAENSVRAPRSPPGNGLRRGKVAAEYTGMMCRIIELSGPQQS
jgi:hypothetical protein